MGKLWRTNRSSGDATSLVGIDPICGMSVKRDGAVAVRTVGDEEYYFCSAGCAQAFDAGHAH